MVHILKAYYLCYILAMEMTPEEYAELTDTERLAIINQLAVNIPSTFELELDAIRVILREMATALLKGNLKAASDAVTSRIYYNSEIDSPVPSNDIAPTQTGVTYVVDAFITHADGSRD